MEASSTVALSGQLARERQMDVLANNVANLSTVGYKGEEMLFSDLVKLSPSGARTVYVEDAGTVRDWSEGPLTRTGNPLDVALQGEGFLEVQTANGIRYTRDGRLKLNAQGEIVTLEGLPVLDQNGRPLSVQPGSNSIIINADGTVSTRQGTVGRLALVDFPDLQALTAQGDGLYDTSQTATPATNVTLAQGMVEESNVQPILEITRLMSAARAAGAAKTFQESEANRHKTAIDRLAKVV